MRNRDATSFPQLTVVAGRHKELAVSLGQLSRYPAGQAGGRLAVSVCREGSREADRLLEEHRGAEGEARRLRAGMETTVGGASRGRGGCVVVEVLLLEVVVVMVVLLLAVILVVVGVGV